MSKDEVRNAVLERFHENLIYMDLSNQSAQFIEKLACWAADYAYTQGQRNLMEENKLENLRR